MYDTYKTVFWKQEVLIGIQCRCKKGIVLDRWSNLTISFVMQHSFDQCLIVHVLYVEVLWSRKHVIRLWITCAGVLCTFNVLCGACPVAASPLARHTLHVPRCSKWVPGQNLFLECFECFECLILRAGGLKPG